MKTSVTAIEMLAAGECERVFWSVSTTALWLAQTLTCSSVMGAWLFPLCVTCLSYNLLATSPPSTNTLILSLFSSQDQHTLQAHTRARFYYWSKGIPNLNTPFILSQMLWNLKKHPIQRCSNENQMLSAPFTLRLNNNSQWLISQINPWSSSCCGTKNYTGVSLNLKDQRLSNNI